MTFLFLFLITIANSQTFAGSNRILTPLKQNTIPDQIISPNSSFSFTINQNSFSSSLTLSYSATLFGGSPLPNWIVFDSFHLKFSGIAPSVSQNVNLTINALDSQSFASSNFAIIIPNLPPIIEAKTQYSYIVSTFFSIVINIRDPNTDPVQTNVSLSDESSLPSWISWNSANSSFYGNSQSPEYLDILIKASDGVNLITKIISLSINPILENTEILRDTIIYLIDNSSTWQVPYSAFSGYNITYNITSRISFPNWVDYTPYSNKLTLNRHNDNLNPLPLAINARDSADQQIISYFNLTTRNIKFNNTIVQSDFAINTTPDQQTIDFLIKLPNNNIMLIWESYLEDGYDFGIYAKIIDSNGLTVKSKFRVNSYVDDSQSFPQYSLMTNENILIAWESMAQDGSSIGIYAKIFDKLGNTVKDEFRINAWTDDEQSTVSLISLSNGNLFFVWQSYMQDSSKYGVFAKIIDSNGNEIKEEFQVNEWIVDSQKNPKIAKIDETKIIIVWMSRYQDGDGYGIYGKVYDFSGNAIINETRINQNTIGDQMNHNILILADKNILITWESYNQDGSLNGLYGQICTSSMSLVKNEFRINDYTLLEQRNIQMAILPNNNVILVWESQRQASNNFGIYAKILKMNGDTFKPEFHICDFPQANQGFAQISIIKEKFVFIGWESQGQDTSSDAIYYKLFDFDGNTIVPEQRINSYFGGWQINLKIVQLANNHIFLAWNKDMGGFDFDCWGQILSLDYNIIPDILCNNSILEAFQGQNLNYNINKSCFIDYDGNIEGFFISSLSSSTVPSWINFDPIGMLITGTYNSNQSFRESMAIYGFDAYHDKNFLTLEIFSRGIPSQNSTTNTTNPGQTPGTDPENSESNLFILILGAGIALLLLIVATVIYIIRKRKRAKTSSNNGDPNQFQSEQTSRDVESSGNSNNAIKNPFVTTNVPQEFICPLTHGIMSEPWKVILVDDTCLVFEKQAIMNWFNLHQFIPVKNKQKKIWFSDDELKHDIEEYLIRTEREKFHKDKDLMLKGLEWIQLRGRSKLIKDPRLKIIVEKLENKNQ